MEAVNRLTTINVALAKHHRSKVIAGAGGSGGGESSGGSESNDTLESKAYMSIIDLLGEGQIGGLVDNSPSSIFLNDTPLMSKTGQYNFDDVTWAILTGAQTQDSLGEGFDNAEFAQTLNQLVKNATPLTFTITDPNASQVRVIVATPALISTDKKGNINGSAVRFSFALSLNSGPFEELGIGQIKGKTRSRFQREYSHILPKTTSTGKKVTSWTIRVARTSPDSSSTSVQNDLYVDSYSVAVGSRLTYPNSAIVGINFNAEQFSSVPTRSYLVDGLLVKVPSNYDPKTRVYTGVWDGTFKLAVTDNPAWILYDVITNARYGLGSFIDPSLANPARLYVIGRYCDEMVDDGFGGQEPRFSINTCINSRADAYQLISDISSAFNGMTYWTGGLLGYMADMPTEVSMVYSAANVIDGMFNYAGAARKDMHSVVLVTWNDPARNYQTSVEYVEDQELVERFGVRKAEITSFGCVSRGQAHRIGKWLLYTERYQSKTISFNVGIDSAFVLPGDVIQIVDADRAGSRLGGRLKKITADFAVLDAPIDITLIKANTTISMRLPDGKFAERLITSVGVDADTGEQIIYWGTPLTKLPLVNAMWVISSPDLEPQTARIVSVGQGENAGEFSITAIPHNINKFGHIESDLILETPNTSLISPSVIVPTASVTIVQEARIDQGITVRDMNISWEQVPNAVSYEVKYRKGEGNWLTLPNAKGLSVDIQNIYQGEYQAQVVAVSSTGSKSRVTYSDPILLDGQASTLPKLSSFTAKAAQFGIELDWLYGAGTVGVSHTEVHSSLDGKAFTLLGTYPDPLQYHAIGGLYVASTHWFKARIADKYGNFGEWSNVVSASPDVSPDKVLDVLSDSIGPSQLENSVNEKLQDAFDTSKEAANEAAKNAQNILSETNNRTQAISNQATITSNNLTTAISKEAADRTTAISKEATDRTTAINAKANEINASVKVQVDGLKTGITTESQARIDGDKSVTSALNAYKSENDAAVASVLSKTEAVTDKNTANTNAITALQGRVTVAENGLQTKAESSALNSFYTKTETEQVAAGQISNFNASLKIGGENLYRGANPINLSGRVGEVIIAADATSATQMHKYLTADELDITQLSTNDDTVASMEFFIPSSTNNDFEFMFATYRFSHTSYMESGRLKASQFPRDKWFKLELPAGKLPATAVTAANINISVYVYKRFAGDTLRWRNLMMEKGTKASSYSEPTSVLKANINANAAANTQTQAQVNVIDGKVTAHSNSITTLEGRVTSTENGLKTKAESSALNDFYTKTQADQVVAGQISNFNASLKIGGANLLANGHLYPVGSNTKVREISVWAGTIVTVANIAKVFKPNTTYTVSYDSELLEAPSSELWNLVGASVGFLLYKAGSKSFSLYAPTMTSAGDKVRTEITFTTPEDLTGYALREYTQRYTSKADANIAMYGKVKFSNIMIEEGNKATSWSPHSDDVQGQLDANANAIKGVDTKVDNVDGKLTTTTSDLTKLTGRVSSAEGAIAKKAEASALNNYYTKTEADQAAAGQISKFDASLHTDSTNIANEPEFGKWVNEATGLVAVDATQVLYRLIPVSPSEKYYISTSTEKMEYARYATYDSAKKFLYGNWMSAGVVHEMPNNVAYISISYAFELSGKAELLIANSSKPVAYSLPAATTKAAIDANASAIQATNSNVSNIDGKVTANTASINSQGSRLTVAENGLKTKAENSAVQSINTEVSKIAGELKSATDSTTKLTAQLGALDSDSLIPDYNLADVNSWYSHYGYNLTNYFQKTTTGKIGGNVFVNGPTDGNTVCWNYNKTALPNTRPYKLSMLVRRSVDSTSGTCYFTAQYLNAEGKVDGYASAGSMSITANGEWQLVERIVNFTSTQEAKPQLRFGFAIGHTSAVATKGTWEVQGYKVTAVLSTGDMDSSVATAEAVNTLGATVIQQGKDITSQSNSLISLNNSLTVTNGEVSKAQNAANAANEAVKTKADASAVSAMDTKISNIDGKVDNLATQNTILQSGLQSANGAISTKAEQSSLNSTNSTLNTLSGKVETQAQSLNTLTSKTTTLENDMAVTDLIARASASGKLVYGDPTFKTGTNGVASYNNANNGNVTVARVAKQAKNPTSSDFEMKITSTGVGNPGLGGFYQNISARASAVFLIKYIICLPVKYALAAASNAVGTGGTSNFIGSVEGTGKYETYYRLVKCGESGTFSTSGHVYAIGATPTVAAPLNWYLASIEVYDTTDFDDMTPVLRDTVAQVQEQVKTLTTNTGATAEKVESMSAYFDAGETVDDGDLTADGGTNGAVRWTYHAMIAEGDMANAKAVDNMKAEMDGTLAEWGQVINSEVKEGMSALSEQINHVSTSLGDQTTRIDTVMASVDGIYGKYMVTIDNNGVLSGFELVSEGDENGKVQSTFGVNADNFYIGSPATGKRPFIVTTEPREINGITYPPGTWIDSAYIAEASIQMAHIDTASISSLSAISATIGTLRTATTGARTEISDNLIKVYDENNVLRVRIGVWDDQDF